VAKQRQTDVNINYRVNTVEVDKAEQLLKKASATTDQARASAVNFGNQAGKSFQTTSKYIEGMEIELSRLRQQIKLTSTQDTARLSQLSTQYKQLKTQVDAYNKSLFETASASKQTAQATQSMSSQFGQVITAVKTFIAVGFAREVVNISLEMAKLSGNVEGVQRAFTRLPGAEAVLNNLRAATHGAVTDLELMQRALKAVNFGISLSALPSLLEFAAVRAQQTGVSVDYMVNAIVDGIGRKSLRVLDNLQISQSRVKEEMHGISLEAASVAQVSEAMGRIASEELQKMGGFAETSATKVDQLTTSWHELNVELAKAATEGQGGGFIGFMKDYVDSFKAWVEAHNRGVSVAEVFAEKQNKLIAQASVEEFSNRVLNKSKEENIKLIQEEIQLLTHEIGIYTKQRDAAINTIKTYHELVEAGKMGAVQATQAIDLQNKFIAAKKGDALIDQEIVKLLQSKLLALQAVNKETAKAVEDTGPRSAPGRLDQVVNLDLKNPVTGEVGKYDKDNIIKAFTAMADFTKSGVIPPLVQPVEITPMDGWDKIGQEFADRWRDIVSQGLFDTTDVINATIQAEADSFDVRLAQLGAFYDEQMLLAGNNDRQKKELAIKRDREEQALRKKSFEADKEAKRLTTIINGAAGVINAFATLPYPAAVVASLLIAGQTAAQVAIISQQQFKGYKDGVIDLKGPGTKTSDSIPANLSKGESVMTADETNSSKGILKAVRARKLNDKVLKEIVSGRSGGQTIASLDIQPIVDGLKELKDSQPDIVLRSNIVYEGRRRGDAYKQWLRSNSMSS
jgi:hypothetical protein